ncbi:dihydrodipicolinate synthase family protein, partial [Acinetobacter baumannii]
FVDFVGGVGVFVFFCVFSGGGLPSAQKADFSGILIAAPSLPAVIFNSPYYELRREFPNLIGFKEFGGAADMRYAAEFITSQDDSVTLMAGVDKHVIHIIKKKNETGAINF